jgi:heme-degrading monooxygenase HmoA
MGGKCQENTVTQFPGVRRATGMANATGAFRFQRRGIMRIPVALSTILIGSLLAGASPAALEPLPKAPPRPIARVWKGKTRAAVADEYQAYLEASGVAKIRATPGNLGVDVFRRTEGEETEFVVTSFWESIDAVKRFAGEDYRKAVVLPKDRAYLLTVEPNVLHYEVVRQRGQP